MKQYRVGILGATGSVGQRFVQLLEHHPWFTITAVVASEKSVGKTYKEAVHWKMDTDMPEAVAVLKIQSTRENLDCDLLFSGLDSSVAGEVETFYAKKGYPVISNSKNHRMDTNVPLLIADVNPEQLDMIPKQQEEEGFDKGFIVTNPNCSVVGLVMALKPLHDAFGIDKVMVTTMQAISGAGYPGIPSMDILDNVVPYIGGEEEKVEEEPQKILGSDFVVSATCNRVAVLDGHLESVSVKLKKPATPEEVAEVLKDYTSAPQQLKLPSAPIPPIVVKTEPDRPQTRLDRNRSGGMAATVGRIRRCPIFDIRFTVLSHNTIRGAAGVAILNAELLVAKKVI